MSKRLKAALIVDNDHITKWQSEALAMASDLLDIQLILSCSNSRSKKRFARYFLYYILNVACLRNALTKRRRVGLDSVKTRRFECGYEGAWQKIPQHVANEVQESEIEVIVKFGMGLLRIDGILSVIPVLSYHHGDPSKYRGRPAGFYELLNDAEDTGVVVQRLSNELDAGEIYAFAHSKIEHHSYRKTALNFYGLSKHLLREALVNYQIGRQVELKTDGANCRLPSNATVLRFVAILAFRKIKRLSYGAVIEKRWKVALVPSALNFENDIVLSSDMFEILPIAKDYTFLADPFFSLNGRSVRVEAMRASTGLGDIIEIDLDDRTSFRELLSGKHFSYPFSFESRGKEYLLPEVASHSNPYYLAVGEELGEGVSLRGFESSRIVDATLIRKGNVLFAFYGEANDAANVLHLAYASSIDDEFVRHPRSPICFGPRGSRMGGRVLMRDGKLLRFGQDNCRKYGSSIHVFEVMVLTRADYQERHLSEISIRGARGPHTIDVGSDGMRSVIDYYEERFSLFAGYRRALSILSRAMLESGV